MPIDYSKFDGLGDDSSDDEGGAPPRQSSCALKAKDANRFMKAAKVGQDEVVRQCIKEGVDVNSCQHGKTALHWASHRGDLPMARCLITARAEVNSIDNQGVTPLFMACNTLGHKKVVSLLLAEGATVDLANRLGATALMVACERAHLDIIHVLIAARANVNHADAEGVGALYMASEKGWPAVVKVLMAAGADGDHADVDGNTPLYVAATDGNADVVRALCEGGASASKGGPKGATPFLVACDQGHLDCVKLLSSYGAPRSAPITIHGDRGVHGGSGSTVEVHVGRERAEIKGHTDVCTWLDATEGWISPLHHLPLLDEHRAPLLDVARVRALLRDGADVKAAKMGGGPTPLALARQVLEVGQQAKEGSPAALVLLAAQPWSPMNHELFPARARALAVETLLLGHLLARRPQFQNSAAGWLDVWMTAVMPYAVRSCTEARAPSR